MNVVYIYLDFYFGPDCPDATSEPYDSNFYTYDSFENGPVIGSVNVEPTVEDQNSMYNHWDLGGVCFFNLYWNLFPFWIIHNK